MSRATPLPPDERRRALIDATLPLLRDHGLGVSTRQIAEAAGIAEGTIFRAFPSKVELIDATIVDAVSPDRLVARLDAAASGLALPELVLAVVGVLQDHARDARLIFAILGHGRSQPPVDGECRRPKPSELNARVADKIAELFAPHAAHLTPDPASAAAIVLALSFGSAFTAPTPDAGLTSAQVAAVLLHGITKENR